MVYIAVAAILVAGAAFFLGPRVAAEGTVRFDTTSIGDDPEAYLAAREAGFSNIRDGLAKEIVWADPERRERTPISIVYLHGFSASKGEVRPLPDLVAAELGANLFYTRLAGHGQDGAAMAAASADEWIDDAAEALAIGRSIGEKVVVIATSTGATLATWVASRPELAEDLAGLVMLSPNYRPRGTGFDLLAGPWGAQLARLMLGPQMGFTPSNELQSRLWTSRYPTEAILPMAALVGLVRRAPVESVEIPALFIFSDEDRVVDPRATHAIIARWGGRAETVLVSRSDDPNRHVNAGDANSPSTTRELAKQVVDWLRATLD